MSISLESKQITNLSILICILGVSLSLSYCIPATRLLDVLFLVLELNLSGGIETSVLHRLVLAQNVALIFGLLLVVSSVVLFMFREWLCVLHEKVIYRIVVVLGLGAPVIAWISYQLSRYGLSVYSGITPFRASHWVITYQDYGFVKRSLPGSVLRLILGDKGGDYTAVVVASTVILITLISLILRYFWATLRPRENSDGLILILLFVSSPATFFFFANENGRFDQINYIILLLAIMLITHKRSTSVLALGVGMLCCIALLTHEAFVLFQYPFLVALCFHRFVLQQPRENISTRALNLSLVILPILVVGLMLAMSGYSRDISIEQFEKLGEDYAQFEVVRGYTGTFFMVPWEHPPFDNFHTYFNISGGRGSPPIALMTFVIAVLPMIVILTGLWRHVFRNLAETRARIGAILIFSTCFVPVIVPLYGVFIDNYRQYSGVLILLVLGYLYLKSSEDSLTIRNISPKLWPSLTFLGISYNLVIYLWAGPLRDHIFPGLASVVHGMFI